MLVQTRRQATLAASLVILLCGCVSVALLHGAEAGRRERLLHVPGAVLLLGYPGDDVLYISRDGEEVSLQPTGTNRAGHHTYPSLSRDGTVVATSYVKSRYPNYREGIATYSLIDKEWREYSGGDFSSVWAVTLSPDGSTLAFNAQRHWSQPRQLLLLDLRTGVTTVLMEPYLAGAPLSWSPDGGQFVYEQPVRRPDPNVDVVEYEIRIRDVRNRQDHRLVSGSDPSWSPSGEWIAYLDSAGGIALVHPDGSGATGLARLRRSFPCFCKRSFIYSPVWSPDSKSLLLNEAAADETSRALIHQFNLAARKLWQRKGKGVVVLGWTR